MSRERLAIIECDGCGQRWDRPDASVDLVATEVRDRGWSIREERDDDRDLCADCAESEEGADA